MQFGQSSIAVPFPELGGDPTSYAPDWRARVADLIASGYDEKKLPKQLKDRHVLTHAKFLKAFKSKGDLDEIFAKYTANGLAMNWAAETGGSKTKFYLQALLLTDQPIEIIAQDLQLDEKVVKLYCDLYFSCRSELNKYEMVLPMETRFTFAFGEISHDTRPSTPYVLWRIMAVRDGYATLVRYWGIEKFAHGNLNEDDDAIERNMSLVNTNLENQLRLDRVNFRSLVEYQNFWLNYKKMKEGPEGANDAESSANEIISRLFTYVVPKMVSDKKDEEEKKAEIKSGKKKLLAEKNIELHNLDNEKAKTAAEFNKLKKERFKLIDNDIGSKP